jgi:ankyrin repeat protein
MSFLYQAANGHEECVDVLIQHGASVNARDVRGRSALHMAAMCGHVALLGMLIQVGDEWRHLADGRIIVVD